MIYYPQPMNGGAFPNAPSSSYPLGYGGYSSGGYYGGLYNTYNPYEIQKQQQIAQQQYNEELKNQRNIIATFYKSSCIPGNGDPRQEILNQIYGKDNVSNQQIEGLDTMQNYEYNSYRENDIKLQQQQQRANQVIAAPYIDYRYSQVCNTVNKIYNDRAQEVSEDIGLFEYLSSGQATKDVLQAEDNNLKAEQSNLGALYDQNGYSRFLNQFRQKGPFAALNPNASIDDLTISLPSMVSEQQRAARRKAFLSQIGLG